MREKLAALLPDVELQPHQKTIQEEAAKAPLRKLLVHGLGSGKTLSALSAAEQSKEPYSVVAPASVRYNWKREQERFTDQKTPSDVMSYSQLALGKEPKNLSTLIFDESHRLRNPKAQSSQQALKLAPKAKQLLMLTGTPVINEPADLATSVSMLTGKKITPQEFTQRYVNEEGPGFISRLFGAKKDDIAISHESELRKMLEGHVDWYQPDKPAVPVQHEDIPVEMATEQGRLYDAMWNKLPFYLRMKLKWDYPLTNEELVRARSFLTGPRQVSLSTFPFMGPKGSPIKAFSQSAKLQSAHSELMKHLADPRSKALVFSNFINAGLMPYSAKLTEQGVPHAVFHGGLSDKERKKLVEDYNTGKIRVALLGPSGTEGLSFKGTQLIQKLDPHWAPVRGRQSEGRGLRFDSHTGLPEDLQNVKVQRFIAKHPLGYGGRAMRFLGFDQSEKQKATDDYLIAMEQRKDKLNQKFMNLLKEVGTRHG